MDPESVAKLLRHHLTSDEDPTAVALLEQYAASYTGDAFEKLADSDRNRFTSNDVVAVSTLSVDIQPEVSIWLLGDGQAETAALLRDIPDVPIWDEHADLSADSAAWRLWDLLKGRHGMGRTKTSKLMAAKRPALIPVYDQHVARALQISDDTNYWAVWQEALRSDNTIRDLATETAAAVGSSHLSVLRTFDIVIWMRVHGYN